MRGNNGIKFFAVLLVIGILTYITFTGSFFGYDVKGSVYDIAPGIDISGGVDAKLYAVKNDGSTPSKEDLETAKDIIGKRLDFKKIYDRNIAIDVAKGSIIVQIPQKSDQKNFDPQKSIEDIGKTAMLSLQEVDENKKDDKGNYAPTGKVVVQGKDVVSASAEFVQGSHLVVFELSKEKGKDGEPSAADRFAEATGRLVGKPIAIFMDDEFISAPNVQDRIPSGEGQISVGGVNGSTEQAEEARELASTIKSGALPFKLEARQVNSISPTLGASALKVIVNGGIVSFILVCLFMLIYYRLAGLLANIALLGHTVFQLMAISLLGITVTLPGAAGIILTIGMGVDANVIIFERIKEELRSGKTLRAAIDIGFKRAFTAILDANMTTLIVAGVLLYFGTGPMKSFAYTLGIGIILSFLTAVVVSRMMLKSASDLDIAKKHWLYGA